MGGDRDGVAGGAGAQAVLRVDEVDEQRLVEAAQLAPVRRGGTTNPT
jgi:hypothetical protein